MNSGKSDVEQFFKLIVILGALIFLVFVVFIPMSQQMRGPAADMTINVEINSDGYISKYDLEMQLKDTYSYNQFLSELNSQNKKIIKEYVFRNISSSQSFKFIDDPNNQKITFSSSTPLDPNVVFTNINLKKNSNDWEFFDRSISDSYFIPEKYIDTLTYTLTIPSEVIYSNANENHTVSLSKENVLIWKINRHKGDIGSGGSNLKSPEIYAKFEVPEPKATPGFTGIFSIIGLLLVLLIIKKKQQN